MRQVQLGCDPRPAADPRDLFEAGSNVCFTRTGGLTDDLFRVFMVYVAGGSPPRCTNC